MEVVELGVQQGLREGPGVYTHTHTLTHIYVYIHIHVYIHLGGGFSELIAGKRLGFSGQHGMCKGHGGCAGDIGILGDWVREGVCWGCRCSSPGEVAGPLRGIGIQGSSSAGWSRRPSHFLHGFGVCAGAGGSCSRGDDGRPGWFGGSPRPPPPSLLRCLRATGLVTEAATAAAVA